MKNVIAYFLLLLVSAPSISADSKFDYNNAQQIYVITDTEAILYGEFPAFIKFRSIVAQTMEGACAVKSDKTKSLYKVRLISDVEHRFIYIGASWIRYKNCFGLLSEQNFNWLVDAIERRKGGLNATLEIQERAMKILLEKQGYPPITGL